MVRQNELWNLSNSLIDTQRAWGSCRLNFTHLLSDKAQSCNPFVLIPWTLLFKKKFKKQAELTLRTWPQGRISKTVENSYFPVGDESCETSVTQNKPLHWGSSPPARSLLRAANGSCVTRIWDSNKYYLRVFVTTVSISNSITIKY